MRKSISLFCFLLTFWSVSFAQQYGFIQYSVEEGLVQTQVTDIAQDQHSYLWISTLGGVSRFDGKTFQNYSNRDGLYQNLVRNIYKDKDGSLWFGSDGGATFYNGIKFKPIPLTNANNSTRINEFEEDAYGRVWAATNNQGLVCLEDQTLIIDNKAGLSTNNVRSIETDNNGAMWIGTRNGIYVSNNAKKTKAFPLFGSMDVSISTLNFDPKHKKMWIGSYGNGVFVYDFKTEKLDHFNKDQDGLIMDWVRDIEVDSNGNAWLATKSGLTEISSNGVMNFTKENGLFYDNLKSVFTDMEGNL